MEVRLIYVQGSKEAWLDLAESLYLSKIEPYCKCTVSKLKSSRFERQDDQKKKKLESQTILDQLAPSDFVVLLDEEGKNLSSIELASQLQKKWDSGVRKIHFVIGGAFGVTEDLKKRANLVLCLSKLTFNHHVARLVLLEQIYRTMMILKNKPYHNE